MSSQFSQDEVQAMMAELGQKRYAVRAAADVFRDASRRGYVVVDTAHQDRVMSEDLALAVAKGWAFSEHEAWAKRCLHKGGRMENCYLIDGEWRHGTSCDCGADEGD